MKKFLSVLLSVCMLLGICSTLAVSSFAEEATAEKTSWNHGSILDAWTPGEWDNKSDPKQYKYDENVFKYVYYYGGTNDGQFKDPVGFYDMVKSGDEKWRGVANMADHPDGNLWNTYSGPAICWSTWHYTPGVCFTAPKTGTVEFTYQYSNLHDPSGKYTFIVVREGADLRNLSEVAEDKLIVSNKTRKTMGFPDGTANEYDEVTFSVDVQEGERIYFVACALATDQTGVKAVHWISSARYIEKGATVLGHGLATNDTLDLRFLVQIVDPLSSNTATVTVKTPYGDKTQTVEGVLYTGEKKDGGNYTVDDHVYSFTVELNAKQLTDEVVLAAVNRDELNATYTVEDYCLGMRKLAAENAENTTYANAANTCEAILLYGYMAQINFNYNTDKLPAVKEALLNALTGANQ